MRFNPPIRFDPDERTFYGFTPRALILIGVGVVLGLVALGGLAFLDFFYRIAIAGLLAAGGLGLALWRVDGHTPETFVWDWLRFKARTRVFWRRPDTPERPVTVRWARPQPHAKPTVKRAAAQSPFVWRFPTIPPITWPDFGGLWLSANVLGLTLVTAFGAWAYYGGAEQIRIWLRSF